MPARSPAPAPAAGIPHEPAWRLPPAGPAGTVRIGISGWTYAPWRGTFFPRTLIQRNELAYASRMISSIEINGTFYALQRPRSYGTWYEQTPADFVFSVKAPRYITHVRRLVDVAVPLANFFASGVLRLGDKLGPILWQLPPSLPYEPDRLEAFLRLLPHDMAEAAQLARTHDAKVPDPWLKLGRHGPLRHALEIRHRSYEEHAPQFVALLRQHGVALVVADTAGKWPLMEEITTEFMYVRLHGDEAIYVSGYTKKALQQWARKIERWQTAPLAGASVRSRAARDVYVYFDNDVKTRSPYDAMTLAHLLGQGDAPGDPPVVAGAVARSHWPALPKKK